VLRPRNVWKFQCKVYFRFESGTPEVAPLLSKTTAAAVSIKYNRVLSSSPVPVLLHQFYEQNI